MKGVTEETEADIKSLVRGMYDIQNLRIQMGNRIVGNFKVKLGVKPGDKEDESLSKEDDKLLTQIKKSYKLIADGVVNVNRKTFKSQGVISTYTEYCLVYLYIDLLNKETAHSRKLKHNLTMFPFWNHWLNDVVGIGPMMGGVIMTEIDIAKAKYPSSLWKYAGLDVAADGRGRSKKEEHLIKVKYTDKKGKEQERRAITFNPFLKTKLVCVLAGCFHRNGNLKYNTIYKNYRTRLENHTEYGTQNDERKIAEAKALGKKYMPKGHRNNMANRYMIKRFLVDLHREWRVFEGFPAPLEYSEAKLGITHTTAVEA